MVYVAKAKYRRTDPVVFDIGYDYEEICESAMEYTEMNTEGGAPLYIYVEAYSCPDIESWWVLFDRDMLPAAKNITYLSGDYANAVWQYCRNLNEIASTCKDAYDEYRKECKA